MNIFIFNTIDSSIVLFNSLLIYVMISDMECESEVFDRKQSFILILILVQNRTGYQI